MDSSSSQAMIITREEFNAFHMYDRELFTRLVITLRRDIRQSCQVMSFLLYLEKSAHVSNLIANLASLGDFVVNMVAEEVVTCMRCLTYDDFLAFVAYLRENIISPAIPFITRLTGGQLTLVVIHKNRENILLEMKKHLMSVCNRAFEDICARAERMCTEEREKAMEKMSQLGISSEGESSSSQLLSGGQQGRNEGEEGEEVNADDRTIFLTFSRGYPVSEAEVHAYFTRRFGEIITAIHMGGTVGNNQTLYATMELNSAAKIQEILIKGVCRTKFNINGKHVWARKFIPSHKSSNDLLSNPCGDFL